MEELYHHGILGQKWGVRRYQNSDGTLTEAGKKRYGNSNSNDTVDKSKRKRNIGKAVATVGAAATVAAAGLYLAKHPEAAKKSSIALKQLRDKAIVDAMLQTNNAGEKIVDAGKKAATKALKEIKETGKESLKEGKKAAISVGATYAAGKIVEKIDKNLKDNERDSEETKLAKQVAREAGKATVNKAAEKYKKNTSSSGSNNNAKTISADDKRNISKKVGSPRGFTEADDVQKYQQLFESNPSDDQRAMIKLMRKEGYSPDQIENWVFHSAIVFKRIGNSKWGYVIT